MPAHQEQHDELHRGEEHGLDEVRPVGEGVPHLDAAAGETEPRHVQAVHCSYSVTSAM
jgi:hypothetical protein